MDADGFVVEITPINVACKIFSSHSEPQIKLALFWRTFDILPSIPLCNTHVHTLFAIIVVQTTKPKATYFL